MRYFVRVGERSFQVDLDPSGVRLDGTPVSATLAHVEGTHLTSLVLDGASFRILAEPGPDPASWHLHMRGRRYVVEAMDERSHAIREMTGSAGGPTGPKPVRAPMPGLVVKVEVGEGARVEPGPGLVVMEAMKMENELRAEASGIVARVHVRPGQTVDKDQLLIDLAAPVQGEQGTP